MIRLKYTKEEYKMNKKNYIIIGITALTFIIAIVTILLLNNNKNWTNEILNSQNYEVSILDCNGIEKNLDKYVLNTLSDKWNTLSNNGPWMGENNSCYTKVTITYENNGIINSKELLIIDDTSLVLIDATKSIYYTNAESIILYLNQFL